MSRRRVPILRNCGRADHMVETAAQGAPPIARPPLTELLGFGVKPSPSTHLEDQLAPEMARLAQPMGVGDGEGADMGHSSHVIKWLPDRVHRCGFG